MQKVQIAATASNKDKFLSWLQDEEIVHLTALPANAVAADTNTAYRLAQVQFALEFITRTKSQLAAKPKKNWRNMFAGKPIATLPQLEETLRQLKLDALLKDIRTTSDAQADIISQREAISEQIELHKPWQPLAIKGVELAGTKSTKHVLLTATGIEHARLLALLNKLKSVEFQQINQIQFKKNKIIYLEVVVHQSEAKLLADALTQTNAVPVVLNIKGDATVSGYLAEQKQALSDLDGQYKQTLSQAKSFLKIERKLQLTYDALLHRQEREDLQDHIAQTPHALVLSGWLPQHMLATFTARLAKAFPSAAVAKTEPLKNEVPPVTFKNSKLIQPFEAVTNIYGKPKYTELDPSPVLSIFFLVAFGLALSDAGYGLVMMALTGFAVRYFKLKRELKKMIVLLFYAGFATTILGALTGGWFGITLENMPANTLSNTLLSFKVIDPVSSPITLLLVAFAIGIVQLLFAWGVKAYDLWRQGRRLAAFLDAIAWITMVIGILLWAGSKQGVLPVQWTTPALYFVYLNTAILVLSQGRTNKNIFLKLGSGALSLYGLVNFLSDVLSYSRLLALGLATGIIGLVVNLIGSMIIEMVPVVGFALAIPVLIGGHIFNLGINALGAFIHSGRLQFVEFFPKFIEGGGNPYKPFGRVGKYVDNPRHFS